LRRTKNSQARSSDETSANATIQTGDNARKPKLTRRRFILGAILASPLLAYGDAKLIEPTWVKVRHVRLKGATRKTRLVHFTDVHHKGDRAYLQGVVDQINALSPDVVLFTGDLIEEKQHLPEALELFGKIKSPLYGVPGNHDYWSKALFSEFAKPFAATGGAWLMDQQVVTKDGKFTIHGATCVSLKQMNLKPEPTTRNILLMHYPAWVGKLGNLNFDLLLAGHSHGGQVRIPLFGPVHVPYGVDQYDMGLFQTERGPLYVNPGIGWFPWPIRFNCRPEITVFDV